MKIKNLLLIILLVVLFIFSCIIGRFKIDFQDLINIIFNLCDDITKVNTFVNIRLPRNLFVVIAGFALSLSGFVYQGIFKNPLVSPDLLGVSSGASVGAIIAILFFGSNVIVGQILAFVFGIIVVVLAIILSKFMKGVNLYSMIISGIIIGAIANSVIMFLKYIADPNRELAIIDYWLMGGFHTILWDDLFNVLPFFIISVFVLFVFKHQLFILTLDDDEAKSLGVNVKLIRYIAILSATILVSSIVSIVGVVSWIGLIVPHIVRIVCGDNYKSNFLQSGLLGSLVLLGSDIIARSAFSAEIPISIITSLLGAVMLCVFMSVRHRKVT